MIITVVKTRPAATTLDTMSRECESMIKKNKTNKLKTQSHNVRELAFDNITLPPLQFQQTQIVSNSCYAMQQCGKFSLLV